jgi:hypothetical protein
MSDATTPTTPKQHKLFLRRVWCVGVGAWVYVRVYVRTGVFTYARTSYVYGAEVLFSF